MPDERTLKQTREDAWVEHQERIKEYEQCGAKYARPEYERWRFDMAYNAGHVRASSLNNVEAYDSGYRQGQLDEHGRCPEHGYISCKDQYKEGYDKGYKDACSANGAT